jgi:hypothetical protein
MMVYYDDPTVRATFNTVEEAWTHFSLMLDEYIERNSEEFFHDE